MNKIEPQEFHHKPVEEIKRRIVKMGTLQMLKKQISKKSYISLFWSSVKFVSWKLWGAQFILVIASLLFLFMKLDVSFETVLKGLTVLVLFSIIFFSDELFKSFTSNMWELEQTFKYDLRQHTTMKMLTFGVFDMLFIFILSIVAGQLFPVSFIQFTLYLLAPFNLFCIVLFSVFTLFRNKLSNVILWSCSGVLVAGTIVIEGLLHVYQLPILYWIIVYVVTSMGLFLLIKQMLKQHNVGGIFL